MSRQPRFELLRTIAHDVERHLVLLTATPHSGDVLAFDRLLGLLDRHLGAALLMMRLCVCGSLAISSNAAART